ncbi:HAMP domain-containing histidine kinase [Blautia schinkii]|nr:HAMP domain-containing histidine kinase [Blautia schinkii]
MKRSGYRTIFHIYLIFFLSLLGTVLLAVGLIFLTITIQKPDGRMARSDWPKLFTEDFKEQIYFGDSGPQIKQAGIADLQAQEIGIQILDDSGLEVFSYQKPEYAKTVYSVLELLELNQTGRTDDREDTAFTGMVSNDGDEYAYVLFFPANVSKVTMYLNGERFTGGKMVVLPIFVVLFLLILIAGILYGFFATRAIKRLTIAVEEIADRGYLPVENQGVFHDLYSSLNTLDAEIRASDQLQAQTEKMRGEWIANITHDLKTPLSPIKGYAEILADNSGLSVEQCRHYGEIMLKNVTYMEVLMNDLKLTYQLESGMVPVKREENNIVRFLKELVIDILNIPEYENRTVQFEGAENPISFLFDSTLFTRAFRNLIINAFVHGDENMEVSLRISVSGNVLKIVVEDNGNGMKPETVEHLFDRYYRGTNTEQSSEGSGLGLAIARDIIELHGGTISVSSIQGAGTKFVIKFLLS